MYWNIYYNLTFADKKNSVIRIIVTYAGAAAAEFSSRAIPTVLQTSGFMGWYISF